MSMLFPFIVCAFAPLADFPSWTYSGNIHAEIGGQTEQIRILYEPPILAFEIPETDTTQPGLLLISQFDLYPTSPFFVPLRGPHGFTSLVEDTVSPETGFFHAIFLDEYPTRNESLLRLIPIAGDTAPISYRDSTLLLQPGNYLLTIPEPSTLTLLIVAGLGRVLMRRAVR